MRPLIFAKLLCFCYMNSQKWSKHELSEVEHCPKELAFLNFDEVEVKEIGQVITPTQAQNPPQITWPFKQGKLYAVFMMDPDAPSRERPTKREWYHWSVLNVSENNVANGQEVVEYVGAGPPKNTGLHRYVVLIYEQPGKLKCSHKPLKMTTEGRGQRSVRELARSYKLTPPVAGACFQAEYDSYVPQLHANLK